MVRLSPVDSPHLIWPVIESSLKRVIEKRGDLWTPDFVLRSIQDGSAGLFHFTDDGGHIAWMVVERMDQGGGVWMNVWILEGSGPEHIPQIIPLIDLLAKQIGATRWRLTGRKGWEKMLREYVKPVAVVCERELNV